MQLLTTGNAVAAAVVRSVVPATPTHVNAILQPTPEVNRLVQPPIGTMFLAVLKTVTKQGTRVDMEVTLAATTTTSFLQSATGTEAPPSPPPFCARDDTAVQSNPVTLGVEGRYPYEPVSRTESDQPMVCDEWLVLLPILPELLP